MSGTKDLGALIGQIGADMRQWEQSMQQVEKSMKGAERAAQTSTERMNEQFEKTGKKMQKIGKSMSMYLTLPIAAFGTLALRTAGNFEQSMNKVAAISQATGKDLESLEKQARNLGASTVYSASEAAEAMSFLAMAGFEVNEVMEAMPATLSLAAAGQMDLARSADIVSNVMQGFGMDASNTDKAVDVLAKTFTSANTNLEELGEAMSYAAPVAKAYGHNIEETAAAIGFLSDAGIKSTRAGTSVRQMLLQLAKKSEQLGLDLYDTEGNMKSMVGILEELEQSGLSTAKVIEELGARAGPGAAVLLDRGSEALQEYITRLEDAGGTAERVAEQQMEGLNGSLKELRSAFEELQIAIAQSGIMEFATNLVKRITELTRRLAETSPEILKMVTAFAGIAAAIGPVLIGVGLFTRKILPLMTSQILASRAAMLKLNAAMLTNPYGLLFAGLTLVGVAAYTAWKRMNQLSTEQEVLNRVQETAIKQVDQEAAKIDILTRTIKNSNIPLKYRKEALEELNRLVPEYNGNLTKEGELINENAKALEDYLKVLKQELMFKAFKEELSGALVEQKEASRALVKAEQELEKAMEKHSIATEIGVQGTERYGLSVAFAEKNVRKANKELDEAGEKINVVGREMDALRVSMDNATDASGDNSDAGKAVNKVLKEQTQAAQQLEIATKALTQAEIERSAQQRITAAETGFMDMDVNINDPKVVEIEKTMSQLGNRLAENARLNYLLGDSFNRTVADVNVYEAALRHFAEQGIVSGVVIDEIKEKLEQFKETSSGMGDTLQSIGTTISDTANAFTSLGNAIQRASEDGAISFVESMNIISQAALSMIGVLQAVASAKFIASEAGKGLIGLLTITAGLATLAGLFASYAKPKKPQGLMYGGDVIESGVFEVGEAGRENVFLPKGAAVRPQSTGLEDGSLKFEIEDDKLVAILDWAERKKISFG